jgi:hypothetical protein
MPVPPSFDDLGSADAGTQNAAFSALLATTESPVDWAYEVWDDLVATLGHENNRRRAIAAQLLCNLARSDPQRRMVGDLDALLALTRDERFVTARHCMQSLWKVGAAGEEQRIRLLAGLDHRFDECAAEKNCTLIRFDIVQGLRRLHDATGDERVREKAMELIAREDDLKYRKKYVGVWKGV